MVAICPSLLANHRQMLVVLFLCVQDRVMQAGTYCYVLVKVRSQWAAMCVYLAVQAMNYAVEA